MANPRVGRPLLLRVENTCICEMVSNDSAFVIKTFSD
jgi:hypothetical protein